MRSSCSLLRTVPRHSLNRPCVLSKENEKIKPTPAHDGWVFANAQLYSPFRDHLCFQRRVCQEWMCVRRGCKQNMMMLAVWTLHNFNTCKTATHAYFISLSVLLSLLPPTITSDNDDATCSQKPKSTCAKLVYKLTTNSYPRTSVHPLSAKTFLSLGTHADVYVNLCQ